MKQQYERVTIGVRLKEFPDVHFSVEVHKNQKRLRESGRMDLMRQQAQQTAEEAGLGPNSRQSKSSAGSLAK
jgi:hypothetical protein